MPDTEETGFTFVDKRGGADIPDADPPTTEVDLGPDDSDAAPDDDDDAMPPHPKLGARDRMLMCLDILGQGAWIALGLHADPATNEVTENLVEAKAMIDSLAAVATAVEPLVDGPLKREIRNLVTDLRANYVRRAAQ
ncbi:MAG: DUF1844 domain-containing protein [Armatimonadetes bacterium]|nr:DUF1844 domain-containing protein [Armatimonadota bacterium]